MNDDHKDPRVSAAYRDLASESTPEPLNREILRNAVAAARTPKRERISWMRPAAWAATVGLSLAVVLEVSRTPQTVQQSVVEEAAQAVSPTATLAPSNQNLLQEAEQLAAAREGPSQSLREERQKSRQEISESVSESATPAEPTPVAEVQVTAARVQRSDQAIAAYSAMTADSMAVVVEDALDQDSLCDKDQRRTAEAWYACIQLIEKDGEIAAAGEEMIRLQNAHPDFSTEEAQSAVPD